MSLSNTGEGVEWDPELEPGLELRQDLINLGKLKKVMLKRAFYFYGAEIKCKT